MIKWFGVKSWGPLCDDCERAPIPVGAACRWCDEPIAEGEDGMLVPYFDGVVAIDMPLHWECNMRSITGGFNHLRGSCTCCGGTEPPDPPDVSRRDAAKMAVVEFGRRNQGRPS